ncbi:FtsK/SpoIIIE domain-containing protein [Zhihengliuella sp.]|uniref:FtsK/SpoIIIE domain-containing protein n=1 Tax=Zhihengliuella sp. TaxID=1954483 RepID=UPI00281193B8|nr:FtsK/SpoIIIE domain-containing protein [Zhihengliuella sp.]
MHAHVTVAGCTPDGTGSVRHFRLDAAQSPTGRMLAGALRSRDVHYELFAGGVPLHDLPSIDASEPLLLTPFPRESTSAACLPGLWLVTRAGPDSGRILPLARGVYRIGRDTGELLVLDPAISRCEATLTVDTSGIAVRAGNGVVSPVRLGEDFRMGTTDFCVLGPPEPGPSSSASCSLPADDFGEGAGRSRPWLMLTSAAAPVAIAVVLALALGSWYFLAFSALGLLTGGVPAVAEIQRRRRLVARLRDTAVRQAEVLENACPPLGDIVLRVIAERRSGRTAASQRPHDGPVPARGHADGERRPSSIALRLGAGPVVPVVRFQEGRRPTTLPTAQGPRILDLAPGACGAVPPAVGNAVVVRLLELAAQGEVDLYISPGCPLPVELEFVPGVRCGTPEASGARPSVWLVPESEHSAAAERVRCLSAAAARPGEGCSRAAPSVVVYDGVAHSGDAWRLVTSSSSETTSVSPRWSGPRPRKRQDEGPPRAWLESGDERHPVELDGARRSTVRRFAAALASSSPRRPAGVTLPGSAVWFPTEPGWARSTADALRFALGRDTAGDLDIDLVKDGPHLLVAGTTGSGKSELLRTMLASLIHRYGPNELALVLVDFKGGATLGEFAREPQAHGLVTDLNEESAARFLRSLRHELRRRERVLGRLGVPGYSAARSVTADQPSPKEFLPRLLVVIDEFRVLADEVPEALPELLRIAAVGRSLGVHLVLATQRPQGVVTAEMRANINTTVCLRVLSDFDAQDLVGTTSPARLTGDVPGRGFLRRSGEDAIAFQGARVTDGVLHWSLTELGATIGASRQRSAHRGVRPLPTAPMALAQPDCIRAAHALFSPELPLRLPPSDLPTAGAPSDSGASAVPIGLLDDVERLRHRPLIWSIEMRRLALVGGPQSGAGPTLVHLVDQVARLDEEHHVYVLDGSGTMTGGLAELPRVSGWASSEAPQRLAEVLDVLDEARFSAPTLIVVASLAGWSSALPTQQFARLDETLARLARTAETRNISLVITGDRDLTSARFFALAEHRLLCPSGLGRETTMMWPRTVPVRSHPGRSVYIGPESPPEGIAAQLVTPLDDRRPRPEFQGSGAPVSSSEDDPTAPPAYLPQFRAIPLPARAARRSSGTALAESGAGPLNCSGRPRRSGDPAGDLPVGLRSPDGSPWAWCPGRLGVVIGAAGTGKTTLLATVCRLIVERQPSADVLYCPSGDDAGWEPPGAPTSAFPAEAGPGGSAASQRQRPDVVLIDDATRLDTAARRQVEEWFDAGTSVVMAARPGPQLYTSLPLGHHARQSPDGILLGPRSSSDGDLWNWRITPPDDAPPGRGMTMIDGRLQSIQIFCD